MNFDAMLEGVAGQMLDGDMADLEGLIARGRRANEQASEHERQALLRESLTIADCFETPAGKACLALLVRKTLFRPQTLEEADCATAERFSILQARREGAAAVIFDILAALAVARGMNTEEGGNA